jgi:RimJ/RimL family protein N-acetyltransferase
MSETLTAVPPSLETPKLRPHETEKVYLSPYWTGKSSPFPESTLPYLFARTKEDGLLHRMFPVEEDLTLPQFIERMSRYPMVIAFDKATDDVIGYSFLSEYGGPKPWTKANIGALSFKKYWGKPEPKEFGRLALDWFFNKEGVAVLYGSMCVWNRMAVSFAKEFHFTELCRLPLFFYTNKGPEDALLFCQTREEFIRHFGTRWKAPNLETI